MLSKAVLLYELIKRFDLGNARQKSCKLQQNMFFYSRPQIDHSEAQLVPSTLDCTVATVLRKQAAPPIELAQGGPSLIATRDAARIQFIEASIAKMQRALEDAEGPHKALLELFIEEGWQILKKLKPHARH